jgi:alanine-glyoxylate transaminase/serine-glyoxylate transaminase/serine-pyruvate transaminase
MLCGTLCGIEMGLALAGVPYRQGGVATAMAYLAAENARQQQTTKRRSAF